MNIFGIDTETIKTEIELNNFLYVDKGEGCVEANIPIYQFIHLLRKKGFDKPTNVYLGNLYINVELSHNSFGCFEVCSEIEDAFLRGKYIFYKVRDNVPKSKESNGR